MKIYNIIKVKYLPATNTQGSRVQLINDRLKEKKIIPFDYKENNTNDMAITYLKSKKIKIIGYDFDYIVVAPTNNIFLSIK